MQVLTPAKGVTCDQGGPLHILDPMTMLCLECGIHERAEVRHQNLLNNEPPPGSVVLRDGWTGTAYQRLFSNPEIWASVGRGIMNWHQLMQTNRPGSGALRLIYVAPIRN